VRAEEYLATTCRPDCDYVDGTVVERNVGRKDHSCLLGEVLAWFHERRGLPLATFPALRIRVALDRYRVVDVCVVPLPEPDEQVFTQPPYICIEILSPDDTFPSMQDRFDDYLKMGVPNVWLLEPASKRAWWISQDGHFEALDGVLRTRDGQVVLPISELFDN
jgi:Uma2 family endonuclease